MPQPNDLSRSLVALDQDSTIIVVVEMSQSSWLVAGMLPGIERQPRKKLEPSAERLLGLLHRWRDEAVKAGRKITRIALAFEAGRDGFWLARWLTACGVEAHVILAVAILLGSFVFATAPGGMQLARRSSRSHPPGTFGRLGRLSRWPVPECSRWVVFPHINGTDKKVRESAADSRTPSASGLTPATSGPGLS